MVIIMSTIVMAIVKKPIMRRTRVQVLFLLLLSILVDASTGADALHISSPLTRRAPEKINDLKASSLFQAEAEVAHDIVGAVQSHLLMIPDQIIKTRSKLHKNAVSISKKGVNVFKSWWWSMPLGLALIPLYTALVHKVLPTMPVWWPLTKMDQLLHQPSANLILTVFLSSNIFYFAAGLYLFTRFSRARNAFGKGFPKLGSFVLVAGVVSTVFHYFQALGSFQVAEALCYLDHAVAISSILYFWHKCGRPGMVASVLALAGLVTLAITDPLPMYPWLHSTWHGLSAGAAVFWAHDGVKRQRRSYCHALALSLVLANKKRHDTTEEG